MEKATRTWTTVTCKLEVKIEIDHRETVSPHLDVDLQDCPEIDRVSFVGIMWEKAKNGKWYETNSCQISDIIRPIFPELTLLCDLWDRCHLNDLNAGTTTQSEAVDAGLAKLGAKYDYDAALAILGEAGLIVDRGYKYGSAWLARKISDDDMKTIRAIMEGKVL